MNPRMGIMQRNNNGNEAVADQVDAVDAIAGDTIAGDAIDGVAIDGVTIADENHNNL